ncbi:unnamed protein product, partial [marine sediment metagenome]
MRPVDLVCLIALAVGLFGAGRRLVPTPAAAEEPPAADSASSVRSTTMEFELLAGDKPAGKMA